MKTLSSRSMVLMLAAALTSAVGLSDLTYAAQWVDVHGTNCIVEYPGNTLNAGAPANAAVFYKGWGLDFTQTANTGNWIHTQIPMSGLEQARFIYVRYYKQFAVGKIGVVHIYNANAFVQAVTPPVGVPGWNAFSIDLGSFKPFTYGLGVSMNIVNGNANTRFIISDVGAYVQ